MVGRGPALAADLGQQLAGVAPCRPAPERLAVRRREREHLAQTVVLGLEDFDAVLEVLEVGGAAGAKGTLDVAGTVGRQVVVALAAALGGGDADICRG